MSTQKILENRTQVRGSAVHGRGVFAVQAISKGSRVMEYLGEVISWKEALRRHPHDPQQPNHTFYFHIDNQHVIDGGVNGNDSRWINHSCTPNCEAEEKKGRIFIKALRDLQAGEELNYNYGLTIDEPYSEALVAEYACYCGSENCRGTLLYFDELESLGGKTSKKKGKAKSNKKVEENKSGKKDKDKDKNNREVKKNKEVKEGKKAKNTKDTKQIKKRKKNKDKR